MNRCTKDDDVADDAYVGHGYDSEVVRVMTYADIEADRTDVPSAAAAVDDDYDDGKVVDQPEI